MNKTVVNKIKERSDMNLPNNGAVINKTAFLIGTASVERGEMTTEDWVVLIYAYIGRYQELFPHLDGFQYVSQRVDRCGALISSAGRITSTSCVNYNLGSFEVFRFDSRKPKFEDSFAIRLDAKGNFYIETLKALLMLTDTEIPSFEYRFTEIPFEHLKARLEGLPDPIDISLEKILVQIQGAIHRTLEKNENLVTALRKADTDFTALFSRRIRGS